jgi:GTP-binding protein HflX
MTRTQTIHKDITLPTGAPVERAFLVGLELKHKTFVFSIEDSMEELARLSDTGGLDVVGQTIQRVERIHPATMIGKGKLQEIVESRAELQFDAIIFNDELAPNQEREIEEAFETDIKVLDRTALILDIFAQHAHTREGALQVELAQYEYRLPRLTRMWTHLARQAGGAAGRGGTGGVGLRGPGERQLELDRREIRARIGHLQRDLEDVRRQRSQYRRKRKKEGLPVISIVGYTNAGKSTLLNSLSGAKVLVEDKLFATLDPTTRRVKLANGEEVLFTDTVGFIEKLPTHLVAAFRATLEEINDSNVLLHVVDVTAPYAREQVRVVDKTLEQIGARGKPVVLALNKMDELTLHKTGPKANSYTLPEGWVADYPGAVPISAVKGSGLTALLEQIESILASGLVPLRVRIPYQANELVALFHRKGIVDEEKYGQTGTTIRGRLPQALVAQFEDYRANGGK